MDSEYPFEVHEVPCHLPAAFRNDFASSRHRIALVHGDNTSNYTLKLPEQSINQIPLSCLFRMDILYSSLKMESEIGSKNSQYPDLCVTAPAIRLMKFKDGSDGNSLEYKLESFELGSPPPFTTLSYTWWDPFHVEDESEGTKSSDIGGQSNHLAFCNQQPVRLRRNLYEALQTIKQRHDRPTHLCVDAICINQMGDNERNSQVGLMSDVAFAWLGPKLEFSDKTHALLYTFGAGISEMRRLGNSLHIRPNVARAGPRTGALPSPRVRLDSMELFLSRRLVEPNLDIAEGSSCQATCLTFWQSHVWLRPRY